MSVRYQKTKHKRGEPLQLFNEDYYPLQSFVKAHNRWLKQLNWAQLYAFTAETI